MTFAAVLPTNSSAESGFTLLEIMLVIVIIAVSSMMIAPSFFSASSVSIDDEAERLVKLLRLGQEEALLSGQMFRISFRNHSYAFQSATAGSEWQSMHDQPYQEHQLSEGVRIAELRPQLPLTEDSEGKSEAEEEVEAVIAYLQLSAEESRQIVDIVLTEESGKSRQVVIQFRPEPGGIRIEKETK